MHCRRGSALWQWALMANIALTASLAGASEIGSLGDLRAATIEGCKLIPAEQVRDALLKDLTVMGLASPSADLTELLNAIQRQLITAYENSGFPRAKVDVGPDASGKVLRIRIDEGRRYVAGALRLAGGKGVDEAALRGRLVEPPQRLAGVPVKVDAATELLTIETWTSFDRSFQESKREPLWKPGSPARFDKSFLPEVEREAHEALLLQGLCWAKVKAQMELKEDGTAELLLRMVNEGPLTLLDQVEIKGLQRFDPKQVQQFLGLAPGVPIDLNGLREIRRKLWESARFLKHEIKLDVAAAHPGKANLTIELMEHPKAPPLGEPLEKVAPDGALMLKLALSLQRRMDAGQPVLFEAQVGRLRARIIFQSNKGMLARLSRAAAAAAAAKPVTIPATRAAPAPEDVLLESPDAADLAITAVSGKVGVFCPSARRRYVAAIVSTTGVQMAIQCVPDSDPDGTPRVFSGIAGGIRTNARTTLTGIFAPVFFYDLVYGHDPATKPATATAGLEIRDGVATLRVGSMTIRFDAATGDLLEVAGSQHGGQLHLRFAPLLPDAFQRELDELAATSGDANDYDANRPVSSLVEFLAACQRQSHIIGASAPWEGGGSGDMVMRLLAAQALLPLDRLVIDQRTSDNAADNPDFHTIPDGAAIMANPMAMARWALWLPDLLYPYGSWPWTIGHEAIMLVGGGSPTVGDELKRVLSSGEIGPIGCLALSASLAQTNREYARLVAKLGLERLGPEDFAKDFRVLLQSDRAGAKVLENLLNALAKQSDRDAEALARMLPDDARQAVNFLREATRKEPAKPVVQVLAARQKEWWESGLRSVVERELRKLAAVGAEN
jgi:hypothetical protein